jgi:hypothetical protein
MATKRLYLVLLPLLFAACATQRLEQRRPVETIRIAADHYDSMAGVTLAAYGLENTTCKRDMMTGTHIVRWYCTMRTDPDRFQYLIDQNVVMVSRTFSR